MLTIHSNGSKWYGESPDSIEVLLQVLSEHPLDKTFEKYGNFVQHDVKFIKDPQPPKGTVRFFGNFLTISHVFRIDTNEPEIIQKLTNAINENKLREDYVCQ